MIKICDKHLCCGCEACIQICPKRCISFDEDNEGFWYPSVDSDLCVECGLCERVCPMLNPRMPERPLKVYAAKNRNKKELITSSSGGLFVIIAQKVIRGGGVVFGARFDDNWNVVHASTDSEDDLWKFMGSKYVQSRIGDCFKEAKEFLTSGRKVLFTGTSCQIAALKNFLRREYDNLITIDVICHGVPSPGIWRRYLKETCDVNEVESISFRDKRLGWKNFSLTINLLKNTANGSPKIVSLSQIHRKSPYMQLFLRDLILRPSCFNCPAKGGRSGSDITIADFWGIELCHLEFDDKQGVGLLIVNTELGERTVDFTKLEYVESTIDEATVRNRSYYISKNEPPLRSKFYKMSRSSKKTLERLAEQLLGESMWVRAKRKIKRLIRIKSI